MAQYFDSLEAARAERDRQTTEDFTPTIYARSETDDLFAVSGYPPDLPEDEEWEEVE